MTPLRISTTASPCHHSLFLCPSILTQYVFTACSTATAPRLSVRDAVSGETAATRRQADSNNSYKSAVGIRRLLFFNLAITCSNMLHACSSELGCVLEYIFVQTKTFYTHTLTIFAQSFGHGIT